MSDQINKISMLESARNVSDMLKYRLMSDRYMKISSTAVDQLKASACSDHRLMSDHTHNINELNRSGCSFKLLSKFRLLSDPLNNISGLCVRYFRISSMFPSSVFIRLMSDLPAFSVSYSSAAIYGPDLSTYERPGFTLMSAIFGSKTCGANRMIDLWATTLLCYRPMSDWSSTYERLPIDLWATRNRPMSDQTSTYGRHRYLV